MVPRASTSQAGPFRPCRSHRSIYGSESIMGRALCDRNLTEPGQFSIQEYKRCKAMNTREVIRIYTKARYVGKNCRRRSSVRPVIKDVQVDAQLPDEAKFHNIPLDAPGDQETSPEHGLRGADLP